AITDLVWNEKNQHSYANNISTFDKTAHRNVARGQARHYQSFPTKPSTFCHSRHQSCANPLSQNVHLTLSPSLRQKATCHCEKYIYQSRDQLLMTSREYRSCVTEINLPA